MTSSSKKDELFKLAKLDEKSFGEICRRFGVLKLSIFGSIGTSEFNKDTSDIDIMVEFDPLRRNKRFEDYFELKERLETLTGRKVDIVTPEALVNPYFRADILSTRVEVYAS